MSIAIIGKEESKIAPNFNYSWLLLNTNSCCVWYRPNAATAISKVKTNKILRDVPKLFSFFGK